MKISVILLLSIVLLTSESTYSQSLTNSGPAKSDVIYNLYKKFSSQAYLKQNDSAIVTGKQIIKIRPHNAIITYQIGELYEKTGDTVASVQYYKHALSILNSALDTMNVKDYKYNSVKLYKAVVLILLGQRQAGDNILKELYNTDPINKQYILSVLNMTRKELIYGSAKSKWSGTPASKQ